MHADKITGLTLIAMCAFGWFVLIPNYVPGDAQQIFPKVIMVFISIPSLVMVLRKKALAETKKIDPLVAEANRRGFIRMCLMALAFLVYLLLIPVIGFFVSSAAATVGFLLYLGVRSLKPIIIVPVAVLTFIHIVIERFLNFEMPSGILF